MSQTTSRTGLAGSTVIASLLVAFSSLCWSGNHIVGRALAGKVPPFAIGCIRWLVPALILAPIAGPFLVRDWPEIRRTWRVVLFLALVGGATFGTLQYVGLSYTTALNVSVLNSVAPVFIVATGWLLFSDRVTALQAFGIAVSFSGVVAIITHGNPGAIASLGFNFGDLVILFNMALWAFYSAMIRKRGAMHWISSTFLLASISALATLPMWIWEHHSGAVMQLTPATIAGLAFIALFPSLMAFAAWDRGVATLGSGRAGVFLHLVPLYSALIAGTALGERIEGYHLIGFALILAGVVLASRQS
ncbi:MAG: DMT family transporter [Proteobacteria bacterium]|nr:DMT family transporter [Pseudomonadota bacterium]